MIIKTWLLLLLFSPRVQSEMSRFKMQHKFFCSEGKKKKSRSFPESV